MKWKKAAPYDWRWSHPTHLGIPMAYELLENTLSDLVNPELFARAKAQLEAY